MSTILYKINNTNKISWWEIEQVEDGYTISWGQDLASKTNTSLNKSHHPTPTPEKEIESRIRRQKQRKGYSEKIPKSPPDLPMLAQKWDDHQDLVGRCRRTRFEQVAIQPKLDGLRCLATKTDMKGRRNVRIKSVPHISNILSYLPEDARLDGEIYCHGVDLQTIQSYVMRDRPHPCGYALEYHVFDLVDTDRPFKERIKLVRKIISYLEEQHSKLWEELSTIPEHLRGVSQVTETCPIKLVPTIELNDHCQSEQVRSVMKQEFKARRKAGYEGLMIRDLDGLYEMNYRSPCLLKYKERQDDEFKIIDVAEGHDRTGIFICETKEGKIFEATPSWPKIRKQRLLAKKEAYIGKLLTVEFMYYSKDKVPVQTSGKAVRDNPEVEEE